MATVAQLLTAASAQLQSLSESARLDAEVLLAAVLQKDRTFLFTWPETVLAERQQRQFDDWLARRVNGEPVAYLTGVREFFGHSFVVSPDTLIPRPDTECLVEVALASLPQAQSLTIADLGTGTGAIAISLALSCPAWTILAVDQTTAIMDLAQRNKDALGADNVSLLQSNWLAAIDQPLDAVISNPPYVCDTDPHLDQGDVRFEPRSALAAGTDGLDDIRTIAEQSMDKLKPGGWLMLEHGYDQGAAVRALLSGYGYLQVTTHADLAGQERVTVASKSNSI